MVVNVTKISQEMEKINWQSIEKISQNEEKHFIIIIKKHFDLEKFAFLQGNV